MKTATRHRMRAATLVLGLAAALTPAAQAAFPASGPRAPATSERASALGARARIEPRPPALQAASFTAPAGSGFDWADAAVGAGIALGGSVLVGGTLVAVRRHGGRGRLAIR